MQAAEASNRPISLQPEGQVPFRAVCGVAALANSRAIGCAPRLASHPEKGLARLQKDFEQALIAAGQLEPLFMASGSGRARTLADPEPLEFFACFRDRQHLPAPVRVFVDFLAEALQDHPLLRVPVWPRAESY